MLFSRLLVTAFSPSRWGHSKGSQTTVNFGYSSPSSILLPIIHVVGKAAARETKQEVERETTGTLDRD